MLIQTVQPVQEIVKQYSSTEYNFPKQQEIIDSVKVTLSTRTHVVYDNKGKLRG